jgi:hypothetical protein
MRNSERPRRVTLIYVAIALMLMIVDQTVYAMRLRAD